MNVKWFKNKKDLIFFGFFKNYNLNTSRLDN